MSLNATSSFVKGDGDLNFPFGFVNSICRPVTLVGYSLGARVIFKCLETLAETEKNGSQCSLICLSCFFEC